MSFDTKLNDAQRERLALLTEELGEVQMVIGKILRHGYESVHPVRRDLTNRQDLERELGDVLQAVKMMARAGDINENALEYWRLKKWQKVGRYLHFQGADGQ